MVDGVGGNLTHLIEQAQALYGGQGRDRMLLWQQTLESSQNAATEEKLNAINDFFNQNIVWESDDFIWGTEDYWATPLETLTKGSGDCEDYAIAKYTSLVVLGVSPAALRLVYVKANRNGLSQAHMVLAWYDRPNGDPLILDNIEDNILRASKRSDLQPVFSFNGDAIWMGNQNSRMPGNPSARISRWKRVIEKIQAEGFASIF